MDSVIENLKQRLHYMDHMESVTRTDLERHRADVLALEANLVAQTEEREQIEEAIAILEEVAELAEAMVAEEAA